MAQPGAERLKTVLFVDFDNIALSLRDADINAARNFVRSPLEWIAAIESGDLIDQEDGAVLTRRILMRRCYANPRLLGDYRTTFTRSGFQIIDCPPLTGAGKNSADIFMVMDILDALEHDTHFDEFIILSSDADFTPVLTRLRAYDRRTVIYSNAVTAAAYRALCDGMIREEAVLDLLGGTEAEAEKRRPRAIRPGPPARRTEDADPDLAAARKPRYDRRSTDRPQEKPAPTIDITDAEHRARIADAVIACIVYAVGQSDRPLVLSQVANDVREKVGADPIDRSDWAGYGSFRALLNDRLPPELVIGGRQPGYLYDTRRHTLDETHEPAAETDDRPSERVVLPPHLEPLARQITELTSVPYLAPDTYAQVFTTLAQEIRRSGFSLNRVVKAVVAALAVGGVRVSSNAIAFIVRGITMTQHRFTERDTPEHLAKAFQKQIYHLLRRSGRQLSNDERRMVGWWLRSQLRTGTDPNVDDAQTSEPIDDGAHLGPILDPAAEPLDLAGDSSDPAPADPFAMRPPADPDPQSASDDGVPPPDASEDGGPNLATAEIAAPGDAPADTAPASSPTRADMPADIEDDLPAEGLGLDETEPRSGDRDANAPVPPSQWDDVFEDLLDRIKSGRT